MKEKTLNSGKYSIELTVDSAVESLPVIIRKHPRSRRMVIRYQPLQHHVSLTLPRYVTIRQGLHFVEEKRQWLESQIREQIKRIPLHDGQVIPVLGKEYTLSHIGGRGVISVEDNVILVPGEASFMKRRVCEWLRLQLKTEIHSLASTKAGQIHKRLKKISLRETSSRWGSCSYSGNLSFSWRLVFAPYTVIDYVVAHEVAHLAHHDHSPAFWNVVKQLCPEHEKAQAWLKKNGSILYAYA